MRGAQAAVRQVVTFFGLRKAGIALGVLGSIQLARGKSLRGPVSAAAFVAVYHGCRQMVEELDLRLRKLLPIQDLDGKLRRFAPGFFAALVAASIEPSHAVAMWILWLWIRIGRFLLPEVPYADIIVGSLAAGINLSTYLWDHRNLAPAYAQFLSQCGGSNRKGLETIAKIHLEPGGPRLHKFCHIVHQGESHLEYARNSFVDGMTFGAKIQIPLHIVTHLIKGGPLSTTLISLVRACLFLGAYPASAMLIMCHWWKITGRTSEKQLTLTALGSLVGISLWVESPGRRKEIAAFTFTHSLLSIWRAFVGRKQLKGLKADLWGKMLFSTAIGVLMCYREAQPSFLQWVVRE